MQNSSFSKKNGFETKQNQLIHAKYFRIREVEKLCSVAKDFINGNQKTHQKMGNATAIAVKFGGLLPLFSCGLVCAWCNPRKYYLVFMSKAMFEMEAKNAVFHFHE